MANNSLPPGWGEQSKLSAPNWNKTKSPSTGSNSINPFTKNETPVAETINNQKIISEDNTLPDSNADAANIERLYDDKTIPDNNPDIMSDTETPITSEQFIPTYANREKSKVPIIVMVSLFVIVAIILSLIIVMHLGKDEKSKNSNSFSSVINTVTSSSTTTTQTNNSTIVTTLATTTSTPKANNSTTTTASTEATTISTTTNTDITTITSTQATTTTATTTEAASSVNLNDYIGNWYITSMGIERELSIYTSNENSVIFSLWYYRLNSIDQVVATLDGNTAYFNESVISGYLTFYDDTITVTITESDLEYIYAETMTFDSRYDDYPLDGDQYEGGLGDDGLGEDEYVTEIEPQAQSETVTVDEITFQYVTQYTDTYISYVSNSVTIERAGYWEPFAIKVDATVYDALYRDIYLIYYAYDAQGYLVEDGLLSSTISGSFKESYSLFFINDSITNVFIDIGVDNSG